MNTSREDSTEKMLETKSEKRPVSVYSVSFTQIISDAEREFLMERAKSVKPEQTAKQSTLSDTLFNWRNAIAVAAILVIGVLHFVFQISFIRRESAENRVPAEAPAKIEQLREKTADNKPVEFEAKKADEVVVPEKNKRAIKQNRPEAIAVKPPPKKREQPAETRAERLRRAERILTGI